MSIDVPRNPVYLSPEMVCELIPGLTVRDLEDMRSRGEGPRYAKPTPRKVVYVEADVHAWMQRSLRETAS